MTAALVAELLGIGMAGNPAPDQLGPTGAWLMVRGKPL